MTDEVVEAIVANKATEILGANNEANIIAEAAEADEVYVMSNKLKPTRPTSPTKLTKPLRLKRPLMPWLSLVSSV